MFWIIAGLVFVAFFFVTCVCCGCVQFEDLFTRSDSTSIGSDWTEEAGSWEISSNELRTSSTNAVAVYGETPTTSSYVVQVEFDKAQNNGTYRIYARLDSSNYVCGEMRADSTFGTETGQLRIISCVSGVETILARVGTTLSPFWLRLCVDADAGVVGLGVIPLAGLGDDDNVFAAVVAQVVPPGNEIAIGTGDTLHTDGFVDVEEFRIQNYTSSCPDCFFACGETWPRWEVQVELAGFDTSGAAPCTSCPDLHGTYTLTLQGYGRTIDYNFEGNLIYVLDIPGSTCGFECIQLTATSNFGTNNEIRIFITKQAWGSPQGGGCVVDIQSGQLEDPAAPDNNACNEGANTGDNVFVSIETCCNFTDASSVPVYVEFL